MIVTVEIDELVLHGFEPGMRYALADALQAELVRVISERGLSVARLNQASVSMIGPGEVRGAVTDLAVTDLAVAQTGRPAVLAASVAGVVYDSISAALAGPLGESEMAPNSSNRPEGVTAS